MKLGVSMANHNLKNAIKSHNLLEVKITNIGGLIGGMIRNEIAIFEKLYTYSIIESSLLYFS